MDNEKKKQLFQGGFLKNFFNFDGNFIAAASKFVIKMDFFNS